MNIEVMRTFYIINHCRDEPLPGWRHSLHAEFLRRNPTFNISEQNIVDRKNVIVRKRYLTDLQLQEVKREAGQILYQQEEFQNLPEVRAEEEIQPQQRRISRTPSSSRSEGRISDVHLPRSQHEERRERFLQLVTHYEFMNPLNRPRIPKLRNVNKARDIISSANSILQQYLNGTNDLQKAHLGVYCASALILELNGQQVYTPNPNRKNKDSDTPMWKKRLEKNIDEYRADADVLSEFLAGNNSRRVMAKTQAIARKAQIDLNNADHRQQLLNLKDLLRQKAKAKGARLRRYNKLTKRKQQNAAFENNQKQFLTSLEKQGEEQPAEIDPVRFTTYWNSIWNGRINHTQLKKEFQEKYKSRVTKLLNTLLSGGNLIKAINSWAVPVLTYSFGIVKWSVTDLDELDRLTRRLLTKFRHLHTNSSVIRLYLPRRRGGRGLLNIKNQCLNQEASLRRKLLTNRDPLITTVAREDAGYTPLSLGCELIPVDVEDVKSKLLGLQWNQKLVIHGLMGYGKSCLINEVLNDITVRKYFDNNIFWINLGKHHSDESVFETLWRLYLTASSIIQNKTTPCPDDVNKVKDLLINLFLQPRLENALIILDDACSNKVLMHFDIKCKTVITTQNRKILCQEEGIFVEVKTGFARRESLELFRKSLDLNPESKLPAIAEEIHRICKGHPMLISHIGSFLKDNAKDARNKNDIWEYMKLGEFTWAGRAP
ncbi:hypothetical protein NQ318_018313 [Aromia moschata]|uniref:NB-ARC domain-containing protein n=1 Tax=Aromia moschata TaxID=1265417 RepID=A0AAV8ZEI0_9CUCU|nr:hypothetical protein NQ318_018313 [Aromia moschata]